MTETIDRIFLDKREGGYNLTMVKMEVLCQKARALFGA